MDIVTDWWAFTVFSSTVLKESNAKQAQSCFSFARVQKTGKQSWQKHDGTQLQLSAVQYDIIHR